MVELMYSTATENDIDFIRETYQENITSLHGNHRTNDDWKNCSLINLPNTILFLEKCLLLGLELIWKMMNCG